MMDKITGLADYSRKIPAAEEGYAVFQDGDSKRLEQIRGYMRIDTPPKEVAAVMTRLFRTVSWPMRRRLASGNPASFAGLLRP